MKLTNNYIENFAGNPGTVKNGSKLAKDGSLQNLCISPDGTLLFGECAGSGKSAYRCSVDFISEESPIARCSCPSRQIPCKHAVALLFARLNGITFAEADVPDDVASKREKLAKREENKEKKTEQVKEKAADTAPSKAKITAAVKKINMQLEGMDIAEKLLKSIAETGLAGIDAKMIKTLSEQIKNLGNYYINGIQTAFNELIISIRSGDAEFKRAKSQLMYVSALLQKSRTYFADKMKVNPTVLAVDSAIEEQAGHVWKLEELRAYGNLEEETELVQLCFYSYDDTARKELVDEGYFISMKSGRIYTKVNYRPYKALKYVKQDDSIFDVLCIGEMFYYPGFLNPRCRWDGFTIRPLMPEDYARILSFACDDFVTARKNVKNIIKSPLADKNPLFLLKPEEINGSVITDKNGDRQMLSDGGYISEQTLDIFKKIDPALLKVSALLVMFENNIDTGLLSAKPLSIVTQDRIIRLVY